MEKDNDKNDRSRKEPKKLNIAAFKGLDPSKMLPGAGFPMSKKNIALKPKEADSIEESNNSPRSPSKTGYGAGQTIPTKHLKGKRSSSGSQISFREEKLDVNDVVHRIINRPIIDSKRRKKKISMPKADTLRLRRSDSSQEPPTSRLSSEIEQESKLKNLNVRKSSSNSERKSRSNSLERGSARKKSEKSPVNKKNEGLKSLDQSPRSPKVSEISIEEEKDDDKRLQNHAENPNSPKIQRKSSRRNRSSSSDKQKRNVSSPRQIDNSNSNLKMSGENLRKSSKKDNSFETEKTNPLQNSESRRSIENLPLVKNLTPRMESDHKESRLEGQKNASGDEKIDQGIGSETNLLSKELLETNSSSDSKKVLKSPKNTLSSSLSSQNLNTRNSDFIVSSELDETSDQDSLMSATMVSALGSTMENTLISLPDKFFNDTLTQDQKVDTESESNQYIDLKDLFVQQSTEAITAIEWAEHRVFIGLESGVIRVLNESFETEIELPYHYPNAIHCLNVSKGSEFLVSYAVDGTLIVFNLQSMTEELSYMAGKGFEHISISPDFSKTFRVALSGPSNGVKILRKNLFAGIGGMISGIFSIFSMNMRSRLSNFDLSVEPIGRWTGKTTYEVSWGSRFLAWASLKGVFIFNVPDDELVAILDPPDPTEFDFNSVRCKLHWISDLQLIVGWGDSIQVVNIQEHANESNTYSVILKEIDLKDKIILDIQDLDLGTGQVYCLLSERPGGESTVFLGKFDINQLDDSKGSSMTILKTFKTTSSTFSMRDIRLSRFENLVDKSFKKLYLSTNEGIICLQSPSN